MDFVWIVFAIVSVAILFGWRIWIKARRKQFILDYAFRAGIRSKMREKYPELQDSDFRQIETALKDYFVMNLLAGGGSGTNRIARKPRADKVIAMPSKIVDDYWHEFILFTREYHEFCMKAFGGYLHHTPNQGMPNNIVQRSVKNAWRYACQLQKMDPKSPTQLPLIFAIDDLLRIEGGNSYSLSADASDGNVNHIGCSGGPSSKSSGNDSSGCSSCSSCGGCGGD